MNYRTEPMWLRKQYAPDTPLSTTRTFNYAGVLLNTQAGGEPQAPVFRSEAGQNTFLHVLMPGGHARRLPVPVAQRHCPDN